jgi:CHAD domain-containing protein
MFDRKTAVDKQTVDPPTLPGECSVKVVATKVLGEMLRQFTGQLTVLRSSDDPEVVHQARVAWRRFKTDLRLFKPALRDVQTPSLTPLRLLLQGLGALRDLDVALTDTLPQSRSSYIECSPQSSAAQARRRRTWRQLSQALQHLADRQRRSVRRELQRADVVATLVELTEWVDGLSVASSGEESVSVPLRRWARQRLADWHERFKQAKKVASKGAVKRSSKSASKASIKTGRCRTNPERQHRARILAKRLRYGVEALGFLLPDQRSRRWRQQAADLQTSLGAARDLLQAHALAASVAADDDILRFLQRLADQSS